MKLLFTFLFLFLFLNTSFTQTQDEIKLEAYPDEPVTTEQTQFDILWQEMIKAKKDGDELTHNNIYQQLKNEYPEKFIGSQSESNVNFATQEEINQYNLLHKGAESLVYDGNVLTYGTNTHIGGNPRTVKLRAAPDGTQYLGFGSSSVDADTLFIFQSTDGGSTWLLNARATLAGGQQLNGFDFFITDTTGGYRIGLVYSSSSPVNDPSLIFALFMPGSATPTLINGFFATPDPDRGFINPVIVSDGYYYDPSTTYWYIAYQDYSSSTPTDNPVRAALTADWGQTWTFTTARTGFNDYDVAIEFNSFPTGDSLYVLLSNNLTLTNSNLRIRKVALSNFTGSFSQFNPANTSDPEFHGVLEVNRSTGEMICAFTRTQSGSNNLAYVYARPGAQYFTATNPTFIAQGTHNEDGLDVNCFEGGNTYRLVYLADGPSKDTVLFKWSFDLSTGVEGQIVVNENNNSSNQVFPSVAGYFQLIEGSPDDVSGIVFAGENQSGLYYNFIPDVILPVELTSFNAQVEGDNVYLNWQTASEINNSGFEVERKVSSPDKNRDAVGNWEKIGFVTGFGTTTEIKSYSFSDNKVVTGTYKYRLKQIDFDGSFEYSNEVEANVLQPGKFGLNQNYPNPFNPSTIISYNIPSHSFVKLELFSVTGEKLITFINSLQDAGYYNVELNSNILNLSSGVYLYRLIAIDNSSGKEFIETKKLLLMK